MPATYLTVLYPATEGSKFDLDYYLKTHMPLAHKTWAPHGLTSWAVTKLDPSGGYQVQALMYFDDAANVPKAMASAGTAAVMADVVNFTDTKPVFLSGEEVASWKA